jgi:prefoldin subunit 5
LKFAEIVFELSGMAAAPSGPVISVEQLRPYKDLIRFKLKPLLGQLESKLLVLERSKLQFQTVLHQAKRMLDLDLAVSNGVDCCRKAVELSCDIGNGYRMAGQVTDLSVIAVNVGCGVIVDLTPLEAQVAVSTRLNRLSQQLQVARDEISKVKGDIASANDALEQLSFCTSSQQLHAQRHAQRPLPQQQ